MKSKTRGTMAMNLLLAFAISLATVITPQTESQKEPLAGISSMRVIVEDFGYRSSRDRGL
jgi:hypothetical protein